MSFVEVVVRLVGLLLLCRIHYLLAEDDHLLKEEDVSVLSSGENGAASTASSFPHLKCILQNMENTNRSALFSHLDTEIGHL